MKKVCLKLVLAFHVLVIAFNLICFLLLFYCFVADFSNLPRFHKHIPFFVSFPLIVMLLRIQYKNKCPLTVLENYLKK